MTSTRPRKYEPQLSPLNPGSSASQILVMATPGEAKSQRMHSVKVTAPNTLRLKATSLIPRGFIPAYLLSCRIQARHAPTQHCLPDLFCGDDAWKVLHRDP